MRLLNIDDGIDFSHVMGANRSFLFKQNKEAIKLLVMNLFGVLCPFYHISANHVFDHSEVFKGIRRRGSRGFLGQTILEISGSQLIHSEHFLWTSKERYNLNSQRENKPR